MHGATDPQALQALAKTLFDAIESADSATLKALYAPGAAIWLNVTGRSSDARAVAAFLPAMKRKMPDRRYVDRQVTPTETGFVHRHRITGTRSDGATVSVYACAIVSVTDGRVTRVDEYLDSAQFAAVFSPGSQT